MLDIFKTDAFGLVRMTDAVNKQPFVPGRIGAMGIFQEAGIDTLDIAIEEKEGVLYLVPARQRGADATQNANAVRKLRVLRAVHLPVRDRLMADEIQGVRAFGSETALETIQSKVDEKLQTMAQAIELTHEYHRIGAIKGIVLDADGTTELFDLFDLFDISPPATVNFDLNDAADGELRATCAGVVRSIQNSLGAAPIMGVHAECGDNFFDALLKNVEVRASYLQTPMAEVLRQGFVYPNGLKIYGAFEFGGIVWENYRGSIGNVSFVDTDSAYLFPVGVPGLFRTVFAPANYIETVNTIGRPMYSKTVVDPEGRWVDIPVQSNPLTYCTRPGALRTGVIST